MKKRIKSWTEVSLVNREILREKDLEKVKVREF